MRSQIKLLRLAQNWQNIVWVLTLSIISWGCGQGEGIVGDNRSDEGNRPIKSGGTKADFSNVGGGIILPDAGLVDVSKGRPETPTTMTSNCGTVTNKTERNPTNVLLVQDTSGSMGWSINQDCECRFSQTMSAPICWSQFNSCVDRWSTLKSAVSTTVSTNYGINWGLMLFSTPNADRDGCTVVAKPQVPIAANSGSAIQQTIAGVTPVGATPTTAAIHAATAYLKTITDNNKKVILLATDGEPNCGSRDPEDDDLANTLTAIKTAYAAGFPVYVVGIGPSVGNLDSMAQNGGTTKYYPAGSPQQLSDALAKISKAVASCTFTSATPPPDPTLVSTYVDKKLVNQDPVNGWSFGQDDRTIVLNGSVCEGLMAGTFATVEIVFGCPGQDPSPVIF